MATRIVFFGLAVSSGNEPLVIYRGVIVETTILDGHPLQGVRISR